MYIYIYIYIYYHVINHTLLTMRHGLARAAAREAW